MKVLSLTEARNKIKDSFGAIILLVTTSLTYKDF